MLNYLMYPEVRRAHGLDPDKYIFVYIDLEMLDTVTTPTRLWKRLLRNMARYCHDAEVKEILEEIRQADIIDNFLLADLFDSLDDK